MPGFRGSYDLFEMILRNRFAVALVAIPLFLYGTWMVGFGEGGLQTKYQAIRLGMSPDEVHKIADEISKDIERALSLRASHRAGSSPSSEATDKSTVDMAAFPARVLRTAVS